jgi:hypothetical protein
MKTITTFGARFSAILATGIRSRTDIGQELDAEHTVGFLQEMAELLNAGHQRPEDFGFLLSHMDHFQETEDPDWVEESADSVELDNDSVSTRADVRRMLEHFNEMSSPVSQETVTSSVGHIPMQNVSFPQTPEDPLLESPVIGSAPSSGTEESSLVHMIPG